MDDYLANPKVYGDVEHDGWTTEEEEDYEPKGKEETSSDEDEAPLPQLGDMHVEFKRSSLPDRVKNQSSSLSLFISCRKVSRTYAKRY